jgi:hypothetical protein
MNGLQRWYVRCTLDGCRSGGGTFEVAAPHSGQLVFRCIQDNSPRHRPPRLSRRGPGAICAIGTGLRRCGRIFDVTIGPPEPTESCEWLRALAQRSAKARYRGLTLPERHGLVESGATPSRLPPPRDFHAPLRIEHVLLGVVQNGG